MFYPNLAAYAEGHAHTITILHDLALSSAQAARAINNDAADSGENFTTSERSVRRWRETGGRSNVTAPVLAVPVTPRVLVWDIENSPSLAHVWTLWNTNVNPGAIQIPSEVMCFAAKWLDTDDIYFRSTFHQSRAEMLAEAHRLLSEADMVISYNGRKHDSPIMNRDLLKAGYAPPSPYRHIDLDLTMKSVFRFPSHSLNYVSGELGIGQKVQHAGFELWRACIMDNDPAAWDKMMEYNIGDVLLTEKLYYRVQPWIRNHPSLSSMIDGDNTIRCPTCQSADFKREGFAYNQSSRFQRYSCNVCGRWFRSTLREKTGRTLTAEIPVT